MLSAILVRGLRDYGIEPLVWGGDPGHEHEWGETWVPGGNGRGLSFRRDKKAGRRRSRGHQGEKTSLVGTQTANLSKEATDTGYSCPCGAWRGSLGLEPTPELYVAHLVEIFREVLRVLRDDGTVWLNMGDSYAGSGGAHTLDHANPGLSRSAERAGVPHYSADGGRGLDKHSAAFKAKDLIEISSMVSEALRQDGWWRRARIIWFKPNPMPESVTDRPTVSHEYLFLLSKKATYYYDQEAIREPLTESSLVRISQKGFDQQQGGDKDYLKTGINRNRSARQALEGLAHSNHNGRNKRTVWTIATQPFSETHFAVFPEALCEPPILAGSSPKACGECGSPWARIMKKGLTAHDGESASLYNTSQDSAGRLALLRQAARARGGEYQNENQTVGWQPTCSHEDDSGHSVVLDPFCGTGTVGLVAKKLGRKFIGVDLKAEYLDMAKRRIKAMPSPMKLEI